MQSVQKHRTITQKKLVKDRAGKVLLDQIRTFDKQKLLKKISEIKPKEMSRINY